MITKLCALVLLALPMVRAAESPAAPARVGSELSTSLRPEEGWLDLNYGGQRLLRYAFATNQLKPYVRELYTLRGDNVLVDSPPDHLHHHGLMYGIRVNGVNFWEERDQPGCERPVGLPRVEVKHSAAGLPQASVIQLIHWVANENAQVADSASVALLVETRTLTLTVNEPQGEAALGWHADFEVGKGSEVTLAGANYHGLGLRLPAGFSRVARHQNSENAPYLTNGTGDVTPARWSAVSHAIDGRPVTVSLFAKPEEGQLPAFFTMVQPFTYLSATQGLDKAPKKYDAGAKFKLDYLLLVYSDHKTPEFLQKRYQLWKP